MRKMSTVLRVISKRRDKKLYISKKPRETKMKFNTKLLHGKAGRNTPDGATLPSISQVSAFSYDSAEHLEKVFGNKSGLFSFAIEKFFSTM